MAGMLYVLRSWDLNQVMKLQREKIRKDREAQAERLRKEQEQAELDKLKEEEEKYVSAVLLIVFTI